MNIKQKIGIVINSLPKTKTVLIQNRYLHNKYRKIIITSKNYIVHDDKNISKIGDIVKIEQSAPISKKKTWKLINIIKSI